MSPLLIHETATILAAAEELYNRVRRPNFFIKIPGTKEGLPAVEEAIFFHGIARHSLPNMEIKGDNQLTENYSVIKPEVMHDYKGGRIAEKNSELIENLFKYDAIFIAGQAKSHCVAWTIDDLLNEISAMDSRLAEKIYILEDCTSPVVIPDGIDYTDQANDAFQRFSNKGMHVIRSTEPLQSLPGIIF